jgi:hypothetical protein
MALPGTPGFAVPPGEDWIQRRFKELETAQREGLASISESFSPVIVRLEASDATLAAQVASIAALVSAQVAYGSAGTSGSGFAITTSLTSVATQTIVTPAGFTQAIVHCTVDITVANTISGGNPVITGAASINGGNGGSTVSTLGASFFGSVSPSAVRTLTGLSGGSTIRFDAKIAANGAMTASGSNLANLNAIVVYLR